MTTVGLNEAGDGIVDRSLLSDQVYTRIRGQILDRDLSPGARIVESELARQLGVSQAPVRDALRRLAHEGLVEQFARRGTFVTEVSEDEARQTYAVRAVLEELAAHQFIASAPSGAVDELERFLGEMRAAAAEDDVVALVHADVAFHRTIWESSGNVLLPRMWPMVEANFRRLTPISNRERFPSLMRRRRQPRAFARGATRPRPARRHLAARARDVCLDPLSAVRSPRQHLCSRSAGRDGRRSDPRLLQYFSGVRTRKRPSRRAERASDLRWSQGDSNP